MGKEKNKNLIFKDKMIYFYSIEVKSSATGKSENAKLYEIISSVLSSFSVNNSLRLTSGSEFITMDVIKNDENYFFGQVGKIKPTAEMQLRNYEDGTCESILDKEKSRKFGLEIFTHFLIDYKNRILSFISTQSAPQPIILNNIVNQYTQDYEMELTNIVSENSVRTLLEPGSEMTKFSYSFIVPDAGYLEKLNVPEKAILQLATDEKYEVHIAVKSEKSRKALICENDKMTKFIDSITKGLNNKKISNLLLSGKTANSRSKKYKALEQEFNAKVKIAFEVDDKGQIMYDSETFRERVFDLMQTEYKKNRDKLLLLANR